MNLANNLASTSVRTDLNTSAGVFFNNYLQPGFTVSQNIDDAIIGYFEKVTTSKQSAKIMASAIIYTSLAQRVDPMAVLAKFQTMNDDEKMNFLSLFLNLNRVGSSFLGTHTQPRISKYVKRTILP